MLKVLAKLKAGTDDFSEKEIKAIMPYGHRIAGRVLPQTLEKLWEPYKGKPPEDYVLDFLGSALKGGRRSSIAHMFNIVSATSANEGINAYLDEMGYELMGEIIKAKSIEGLSQLFDYVLEQKDERLSSAVFEFALLGEVPAVDMIDPIISLVQQKAPDKVARMMSHAALGHAVWDNGSDESAIHLAKRILELSGREGMLENFQSPMFEDAIAFSSGAIKNKSQAFLDVLKLIEDSGDIVLLKDIFQTTRIVEYAAAYLNFDVFEMAERTAVKINDPDFAKFVDDTINSNYGDQADFINEADVYIDMAQDNAIDPQQHDYYLKNLCRLWLEQNIKSPQKEFNFSAGAHPAMLQAIAWEGMTKLGDWNSQERFRAFLRAIGDDELEYNPADYFKSVLSKGNAEEIQKFIDLFGKTRKPRFMQTLLSTVEYVGQFPLHTQAANPESSLVIAKALLQYGGQDLLTSMIGYGDFSAITVAQAKGNTSLIAYALEHIKPELKDALLEKVDPKWRLFVNDEIGRSKFWQEIGVGNMRWEAMTGHPAPCEALKDFSPYGFKPKLYEEILPLMQYVSELEGNKQAEVHAYKLSVLFSNAEEVDRYLMDFALKRDDKGSRQIVHDACLFVIPDNRLWTPKKWKNLALKYGTEATRFLGRAAEIEACLGESKFPQTLQELQAAVQMLRYDRASESPKFAKIFALHDLPEDHFNFALDTYAQEGKTTDVLPDIFIDGNDIGHPNYYMSKLDPDDLRGFILGKFTACCQSIGEEGHDCAIHGMTSEESGFYVWKRKTQGEITDQDAIVAQSWVWIGTDGNLVFDSFEREKSAHAKLVRPFLEHFSFLLPEENEMPSDKRYVKGVRLGVMGNTPSLGIPLTSNPSDLDNYNGRYPNGGLARDSEKQYEITPIDRRAYRKEPVLEKSDLKLSEHAALEYIKEALIRFEEDHGIIVKTGIELEFYAVGADGEPSSELIDKQSVRNSLKNAQFDVIFDDENPHDKDGQYEIATKPNDPLSTILEADRVREFLKENARRFRVREFDFSPLPFEECEASSAHISVSLWSKDGMPLFADQNNNKNPLVAHVAKGLLEIQRYCTLMYAQTDEAYKRFGNTEWSPGFIDIADEGGVGASLRFANQNNSPEHVKNAKPENFRLENRLAASDANIALAMAATIAGIDLALKQYKIEKDSGLASLLSWERQELPKSRLEAWGVFMAGLKEGPLSDIPGNMFKVVADDMKSDFAADSANYIHASVPKGQPPIQTYH